MQETRIIFNFSRGVCCATDSTHVNTAKTADDICNDLLVLKNLGKKK